MRSDKDFLWKNQSLHSYVWGWSHYQEWGKPAQELNVGDTVYIAPEIKHWHGAAPESYFVHIAESVPNKNASNQWLEAVDEEEYLKLKQNKTIRKGCLIVVYLCNSLKRELVTLVSWAHEMCEIKNHLLCGWSDKIVIQRNHLSDIMKLFKLSL